MLCPFNRVMNKNMVQGTTQHKLRGLYVLPMSSHHSVGGSASSSWSSMSPNRPPLMSIRSSPSFFSPPLGWFWAGLLSSVPCWCDLGRRGGGGGPSSSICALAMMAMVMSSSPESLSASVPSSTERMSTILPCTAHTTFTHPHTK